MANLNFEKPSTRPYVEGAILKRGPIMGKLITETPYSEVNATLEVLDHLGIERGDLTRFRKASSDIQQQVVRLMKYGEQKSSPTHSTTISVDYNMSLKAMIVSGLYDWVNKNITEEHFPIAESGVANIAVELVQFGRKILFDDAVAELRRRDLRPATLAELLAFGNAFPMEQCRYPIMALGSEVIVDRLRYVAFISKEGSDRGLDLDSVILGLDGNTRFLAVRNEGS